MNSYTPCFPPVILEKFLDLAKCFTDKNTGKVNLEINLGSSRFNFSLDNSSKVQTGSPSQAVLKKQRKKSPSDRRRDARRREKLLENKRNLSSPGASSSNPSSTPSVPVIKEPLPIQENPSVHEPVIEESLSILETSDAMDTTVLETEPAPVNLCTRNNSDNDDEEASTIQPNLPPTGNPDHPEQLHEVVIIICAPSKSAAKKRSKQFPESKMISSHPSDIKHHFTFSTNVNDEYLTKLKNNINKFEDLLLFHVTNENEDYQPDHSELHHCQQCKSSGIYAKWLEQQNLSE